MWLKLRRWVPRSRAEAVTAARPACSGLSSSDPTSRYPEITTDGLEKFSRARKTRPFENSRRKVSSAPGRDLRSRAGKPSAPIGLGSVRLVDAHGAMAGKQSPAHHLQHPLRSHLPQPLHIS